MSETDAHSPGPGATAGVRPPEDAQLSPAEVAAESARGRLVALFALAAVLTTSGSLMVTLTLADSVVRTKNTAQFLAAIDQEKTAVIVAASLLAIGTACTLPVLLHLAVAARMRRPRVPSVVVQLSVAGPLVLAVVIPLTAVLYAAAAGDFVDGATRSVKAADELLTGGAITAARIAASVGAIATGFAWVMVGAYGIRTGLLTRPVGSVAVGVGLLTALTTNILPPFLELLKVFELGAIAVMLVGPPERRPPAWREGRVVPWPPLGAAAREQAARTEGANESPPRDPATSASRPVLREVPPAAVEDDDGADARR